MRAFWVRIGFVAAIGCGGSATSLPPDQPRKVPDAPADETTENLVHAALIADVSSVAPGQELNLGVRFDVEPTWHIYWLNPGEAGLPTEVKFSTPDGFEVGDVRYPGPTRFEDPGGVVTYGYEELAMLSAAVIAPDNLDPSSKVTFTASASWLACREACIRGSAETELLLSVAGPDTPSRPSHAEMWSAHLSSIPEARSDLETRWEDKTLVIVVPGAQRVEYFPSPAEQQVISGAAAVPSDDAVTVRVSYRELDGIEPPTASTGVLRIGADEAHYYRIDIPWPEES